MILILFGYTTFSADCITCTISQSIKIACIIIIIWIHMQWTFSTFWTSAKKRKKKLNKNIIIIIGWVHRKKWVIKQSNYLLMQPVIENDAFISWYNLMIILVFQLYPHNSNWCVYLKTNHKLKCKTNEQHRQILLLTNWQWENKKYLRKKLCYSLTENGFLFLFQFIHWMYAINVNWTWKSKLSIRLVMVANQKKTWMCYYNTLQIHLNGGFFFMKTIEKMMLNLDI